MRKKTRIPGSTADTAKKPLCKQCLDVTGNVIDPATGRPFSRIRGDEHVVRFMGAWACLKHFKVDVKGQGIVPLEELIRNRQHRRQMGHTHGVR